MRTQKWGILAVVTLAFACGDQPAEIAAPAALEVDPGPPIVATAAELQALSQLAADPYLAALAGELEGEHEAVVLGALGAFGTSVRTAPHQSYVGLESALFSFQVGFPEATDESDAALAAETLELYRSWSEMTLYGFEN